MTVYLLHFCEPMSHAQHYLGSATRLKKRVLAHALGRGARITQVLRERGIGFILARTWEGSRKEERKLKGQKNARRLCPICQGTHPILQATQPASEFGQEADGHE